MDKKAEYNRKYDQQIKGGTSFFRQVDRERSLIHLMRINLLKRLESSIDSFGQSLIRLSDLNNTLINRIEEHADVHFEELNIADIQTDDPLLEDHLIGNKKNQSFDTGHGLSPLEAGSERRSKKIRCVMGGCGKN